MPIFRLSILSFILLVSSTCHLKAQNKCIDLGVGIEVSNGELALIDFFKNAGKWEPVGNNNHPWYKVYSLDTFKVVNGAYYNWDTDWSGSVNNEAWGANWADCFISFWDMMVDQGKIRPDGYPKQFPLTVYKYKPKSADPNQGLDMTKPVNIKQISRRIYFPKGLTADGWILRWKGKGTISFEGMEVTAANSNVPVTDHGNSWTPDGSYAGRNYEFTSTNGGRVVNRHFWMVHGWVLNIIESDPNDPIRDIEYLYPGQEANYDAGQRFTPLFLERMKQFKSLRYMGYLNSNNIEGRRVMAPGHPYHDTYMLDWLHWNERTPENYYTLNNGNGGNYEYIIDLANQTQTNPWINIPYCAGTSYADSVVRLFMEKLNPDLTLYIEVGNELWNYGQDFNGFFWQARKRVREYPGLGDVEARGAYLNTIFKQVTETAGPRNLPRIQRVYGAFPRYYDVNNRTVQMIDPKYWDALATTWYFSLNADNSSNNTCRDPQSGTNWRSVLYNWHLAHPSDQAGFNQTYRNCLLNEFRCQGGFRNNVDAQLAKYYNKKLICYEGGNHTFYGCSNGPTGNKLPNEGPDFESPVYPNYITDNAFINAVSVADESPEMGEVFNEVIDSLQSAGYSLANHLAFSGTSSCYGVWDLIQSRDIEAPLSTLLNRYNKFKVFSDRIKTDNCTQVNITLGADTVGPGLSIMLDGVNDYVEGSTAFLPDELSNYTMEAWIKPAFFDWDQIALSLSATGTNDNYNVIKIRSDKKVVWEMGNNTTVAAKLVGPDLLAGQWYHIAVVKNGSRYALFVNGSNVANNNFSIPQSVRERFTIGALFKGSSAQKFFTGEIDEVRLWNTARTITEVRDYMCKKVPATYAGFSALRTYFRFDRPDYGNMRLLDNATNLQTGTLRNITITERSRYAVSGAPIGDYSNYIYPSSWTGVSISLTHPRGDRTAVYNIAQGNPSGIQVYMYDGKSHYNDKPIPYSDISEKGAIGVFSANDPNTRYDISYLYNGNPDVTVNGGEDDLRFLRRDNYSVEEWLHAGAKLDATANSLNVSCKEKYRGEYTIGHRHTTNQIRPGSGTALLDNQTPTGNVMGKVQYLNLNDFTVTFWAKGYGEVFNLTSKLAANACRFTLNNTWEGHTGADFRYGVHWTYDISFGPNTAIGEHTEWHHYAITKDNSNIRIYQDGMEVATGNVTQNFPIQEMYLFNAPAWQAGNFPGRVANLTLDELTLWDIPLDQNTIREWMCKKVNKDHPYECEHLKLYFNFDENTGNILEDKRGPSDIVLSSDSQGFRWVPSGAAIGDVSTANYTTPENTTLTHPDGDFLEATRTSGTSYGTHIYRVDHMAPIPLTMNSPGIHSLDSSRYWGLYVAKPYGVKPTYSLVNHYEKNAQVQLLRESELRFLSRTDNATSPWSVNINITPNAAAKTITLTGQTRGEYVLGGIASNTFNSYEAPAQPVFLTESASINRSTICGNSTNLQYKLQRDPLATSYIWTLPAGLEGFSSGDSIIINSSYTGATPLNATVSVRAVNAYGESPEATYTIKINPPPTVADAGPDQIVLPPITSTTLEGNFPTATETGTWLLRRGTGYFADFTLANTQVNSLGTGTNVFAWQIENMACPPSIDTMRVLVAPSPINIVTIDNTPLPTIICAGTELVIMAIAPEDINPTGYQWQMPNGLSIIAQTGNTARVHANSGMGGPINVSAMYGTTASLPFQSTPVSISAQPEKPVFIDKPSVLCLNVNANASIQYNSSIDSVKWTLPYGIYPTQFPKSTLETIEVEAIDITSGYIKAKTYNKSCTNIAAEDSFLITVSKAPAKPELYLGTDGGTADAVCVNSNVLLWVRNPDSQVTYEWRWNTSVSFIQYFNENRSGGLFHIPDENQDIWVRAVQGTGACNASEWYNFNGWVQNQTPARINDVVITSPAGQNPLALQVGNTYTFTVSGNADNYYWYLPPGFELVNEEDLADNINKIRVVSASAGYLEVYPVTMRGCTGNAFRLNIGTSGALLPPAYVSGITEICQGLNLNIAVTKVTGATEYIWTLPNNTTYTTTGANLNRAITTPMKGMLRVVASNGSTQSLPLEIPIKVNATSVPEIEFIDASSNPVDELEICSGDSHRPVYIKDGLAGEYIWDIHGTALQFEPRNQPGHENDIKYELTNRISPVDTMMPVSWVNWRCVNDGKDGGYIRVRGMSQCGGANRVDSIHYYWAQPLNIFVPEFTRSPEKLCVGSIANFEVKPIQGAEQYIWRLPNGLNATDIITTVPSLTTNVTNGTGGSVQVFATSPVCGGTRTIEKSSLPVTISGTAVDFHFIDQPTAACPGTPLTYSVNNIGPGPYLWQIPQAMNTIIIDDSDVAPADIIGSWTIDTRNNLVNGKYRRTNNNSTTKSITYCPNLPVTGKYRVSVSYFQEYLAKPDMPVAVNDADGVSSHYINLSVQPNDGIWQVLGDFNFNQGTSGSVTIGTDASNNGNSIADAVRFEMLGVEGGTSMQFPTNKGIGGAVCVSTSVPQCTSEYTICTEPVNVSGEMDSPVFSVQENTVCVGQSYTFRVNDIKAESYTWHLPSGMRIGSQTGIVTGQPREVSVIMENNSGASGRIGINGDIPLCNLHSDTIYSSPITFNGAGCAMANPVFSSQSSRICATSSQTYSVLAIPSADYYQWIIPAGLRQVNTLATGKIPTVDPFITVEPVPARTGLVGIIRVIAHSPTLGNSDTVSTISPISVITNPASFSVTYQDISTCNSKDGAIIIETLSPNTDYNITYNNGSLIVGPTNYMANPDGTISIPVTQPGTYGNLVVDLNGCSSAYVGMSTIKNSSGIQITSTQAFNPASCTGTGRLKMNVFGATPGASYQIDYTSDGIIDNIATVNADTLSFTNLPVGLRITNPEIIQSTSNCRTSVAFSDTILAPGSPTITRVKFINSDTCGNDGRILIALSKATHGDNYAIDFNNDGTAEQSETVSNDTISLTNVPINTNLKGIYLTNMRNSCKAEYATANEFKSQPNISISDVRFINPSNCSDSGRIEVQLTGITATDRFLVDLNNDGTSNGEGITGAGIVTYTKLLAGETVNGLTLIHEASQCRKATTISGSIPVAVKPVVFMPDLSPMCINSRPYPLQGGTPAGGSYYVNGSQTNIVDPQQLQAGNFTVVYKFSDADNCTNADTVNLAVNATPSVTLTGEQTTCPIAEGVTYAVNYSSENQYTWSIIGGEFFPGNDDGSIYVNWADEPQGQVKIKVMNTSTQCADSSTMIVEFVDNEAPILYNCEPIIHFDAFSSESMVRTYIIAEADTVYLPKAKDKCFPKGINIEFSVDDGSSQPLSEFAGTILAGQTPHQIYWSAFDKAGNLGTCITNIILDFPLVPPSAFSPNGDEINDSWEMGFLVEYPACIVQVYNRWGMLVYESEKGYPRSWDGRSKGNLVPLDTYYYVITLGKGEKPLKGIVTVIY
jgi:gliding motility-associated-like protein